MMKLTTANLREPSGHRPLTSHCVRSGVSSNDTPAKDGISPCRKGRAIETGRSVCATPEVSDMVTTLGTSGWPDTGQDREQRASRNIERHVTRRIIAGPQEPRELGEKMASAAVN